MVPKHGTEGPTMIFHANRSLLDKSLTLHDFALSSLSSFPSPSSSSLSSSSSSHGPVLFNSYPLNRIDLHSTANFFAIECRPRPHEKNVDMKQVQEKDGDDDEEEDDDDDEYEYEYEY